MLNSIKLYLYGAAAGLVAILFGWLKVAQYQRDKVKLEVEKQAQARMAENAKHKQQEGISNARVKANDEAKQVKPSDTRGKRPTANFGDKRL